MGVDGAGMIVLLIVDRIDGPPCRSKVGNESRAYRRVGEP